MTNEQEYLLRFADTSLILAQRLGEWCGHGPALEEDIALSNIALDHLGQATSLYKRVAEIGNTSFDEDHFAFTRNADQFRNLLIVELPNGDYAKTIARQFLFSTWYQPVLGFLTGSSDEWLRGFAEKSIKEMRYHVQHSTDWMIRMGDGTQESHHRIQKALNELWPYTGELFDVDALDRAMIEKGIGVDFNTLKPTWKINVEQVIHEATLTIPKDGPYKEGGKKGHHTEHLVPLLTELQFLQRAYPGVDW